MIEQREENEDLHSFCSASNASAQFPLLTLPSFFNGNPTYLSVSLANAINVFPGPIASPSILRAIRESSRREVVRVS